MVRSPRRDRVLRVRATSEEIDRWKAMARASGMPLSELVRQSIGRARAWSPDRAAVERDRTLQLARIGSNLNQVARWANARKSAADAVRVTAALVALQRDLEALSLGRRKGKPAGAD
ncbi:MAG: MobC family plasmid mobilization relaxosome protein [Albidovulum sp.]|nr:MobC family plasmid mobilization relaxosome protein [Albidovulum sp.]